MDWAVRELLAADFGDVRLAERFIQLVQALEGRPEASVPQACEELAAVKAAYRFWSHTAVQPAAILRPHVEQTVQRAAGEPVVLALQDTTLLNFSSHPKTRDLGYLKTPEHRGLLLHQVLAVSGEGVPLGLLQQQFWTRPDADFGKRKQCNQKPTVEKETECWRAGLAATVTALGEHPCVVVVGDREADFYDLLAAPRPATVALLLRVREWHRRVVQPAGTLKAALEAQRPQAQFRVEVPRADGKAGRTALLELRWRSLEIQRPVNHPDPTAPASLRLGFLLAREETPPPGTTAICWLLVSSRAVTTVAEAGQLLGWYALRGRIEQFHYVQKSGCRIEQLQLETAERLACAIATYSLVAWHLLYLTYQARRCPEVTCVAVLPELPWQLLYRATHHRRPLPPQPPTLQETVRWIAQLGGFLGRRRDGLPGVTTLWRGWRRLEDLHAGYLLARPPDSSETYG